MSFICDLAEEMIAYLRRPSERPPREKTRFRGRYPLEYGDSGRGLDKEERISLQQKDQIVEEPRLNLEFPYRVIEFDPEFWNIPANPPTSLGEFD